MHNVRTTRAQAARNQTPVHDAHDDDDLLLDDIGPLPEIPPRAGFQQRWFSTDRRRQLTAARRGWLPRSPSTVAKHFQNMTVQHEGMGGVIATHDLVLMERREEIHSRVVAHNRQKVRNLEIAVSQTLGREHQSLKDEGPGFYPNQLESTARVERGHMPVATDED